MLFERQAPDSGLLYLAVLEKRLVTGLDNLPGDRAEILCDEVIKNDRLPGRIRMVGLTGWQRRTFQVG